jgi:acyl carrier protein phosphodiesterase
MKYSSIIAFHLDNFTSADELEEVLKDAGLDEKIEAERMFELKADGFDKIFLDVQTGNAIAYHVKGMNPNQVVPMQEFIGHLVEQPCVSKIITRRPLDMDEILDKIYKKGMNSLTDRERKFLREQSE